MTRAYAAAATHAVGWPCVRTAPWRARDTTCGSSSPGTIPYGAERMTVPQPFEPGLCGSPGRPIPGSASPLRHAVPGARRTFSSACASIQRGGAGGAPSGSAPSCVANQRRHASHTHAAGSAGTPSFCHSIHSSRPSSTYSVSCVSSVIGRAWAPCWASRSAASVTPAGPCTAAIPDAGVNSTTPPSASPAAPAARRARTRSACSGPGRGVDEEAVGSGAVADMPPSYELHRVVLIPSTPSLEWAA